MNLAAKVELKNDHLVRQKILLQQMWSARVEARSFSSCLITFVLVPFAAGILSRLIVTSSCLKSHHWPFSPLALLRFPFSVGSLKRELVR